ncbi:MAG: choice-of-anchor tandem repeat GloVer-containing protein, partial [Rhizomicrobium sp.]
MLKGISAAGAVLTILLATVPSWGATESVLYSFEGGNDGSDPVAGLIADANGNFYGTTSSGGTHTVGTVFKFWKDGSETILYNFGTTLNDGGTPEAGLIADKKGNLYGTAGFGGAYGEGVVFELAPNGTYTVLHPFSGGNGGADGAQPYAALVADKQGTLYGTTWEGGGYCSGVYGCGTLFEVPRNGAEQVLHDFGFDGNGFYPKAGVIIDKAGNFFGTTDDTVFEFVPGSGVTALYTFCSQTNCSDGSGCVAG